MFYGAVWPQRQRLVVELQLDKSNVRQHPEWVQETTEVNDRDDVSMRCPCGKAHLDGPEGVRVDEAVPRRALDLIDNRAHLELVHRRVRAHGLAFLY